MSIKKLFFYLNDENYCKKIIFELDYKTNLIVDLEKINVKKRIKHFSVLNQKNI